MWNIESLISQSPSHACCWVTRCEESNSVGSSSPDLHWAKLYTGCTTWPEFESFCRQASIGASVQSSGLIGLTESILEIPNQRPLLVYPKIDMMPIEQWLRESPQQPVQSVIVWQIRQTVETLCAIHQVGLVHGQVDGSHVLVVRADQSIRLVGLGSLEVVGTVSCLPRLASRFDAPERLATEYEVSTAADIYSVAVLMSDALGKQIEDSPIIQAMMADNPNHRPSASEVAALLLELEQRLFGESISLKNRGDRSNRAA